MTVISHLQFQVVWHAVFVYLRNNNSRCADIDKLTEVRHCYPIFSHQHTIGHNYYFRTLNLLFHIDVDDSFHFTNLALDACRYVVQCRQIVSKYLNGYLRFCSGEHGVDAMGNRLPDFNVYSGDYRQFLSNVAHQLLLAAVFQFIRSLNLRRIAAARMLIKFGTSCLTGNCFDFRNTQQCFIHLLSYFVGILE